MGEVNTTKWDDVKGAMKRAIEDKGADIFKVEKGGPVLIEKGYDKDKVQNGFFDLIEALSRGGAIPCIYTAKGGERYPFAYCLDRDFLRSPFPLDTSPRVFIPAFLHEVVHSTGHPSRLNRACLQGMQSDEIKGDDTQFSPDYCREEIVADLGSWLLCRELGAVLDRAPDVAIGGWLNAGGWQGKERRSVLARALVDARKACRYITEKGGLKKDGSKGLTGKDVDKGRVAVGAGDGAGLPAVM